MHAHRAVLVTCLLAAAGCATAPAAPPGGDAEVVRAQDARFAAMAGGDLAALEPLLASDLRYCHSNGTCYGRAEFLEDLRSRNLQYRSVEALETEVRHIGDAGRLTLGTVAITGSLAGQELRVRMRYTAVYVRRDARWQLLAWQTTRVP
ncbi:MAG: nuclear transport factor 2 family protein [Steroidobacteraceae bacterium]